MNKKSILYYIKQIKTPAFTTRQLSMLSGKSISTVTQTLNFLEREGVIFKINRGLWTEVGNISLSVYTLIPYLLPNHRAYLSFISALHLHGIIEQIPQVVTIAATAHSKTIKTKIGVFSIHRIAPSFFKGFDWYKGTGLFLIAEPEKALVDSLYLSACKKKHFGHFPELHFPKTFSFKRAEEWIKKIHDPKIKSHVQKKLDLIIKSDL